MDTLKQPSFNLANVNPAVMSQQVESDEVGTNLSPSGEDNWQLQASCAQMDPGIFYPEKGESNTIKTAKLICGQCAVRSQCLAFALDNNERFGVWGGLSERERRKLKRSRAA